MQEESTEAARLLKAIDQGRDAPEEAPEDAVVVGAGALRPEQGEDSDERRS